ncbi:nuclear shuttle protein [Pepper yellow leaf curl Indonesia virus]|uniref:Nuclear shuttle protein n=1 Tax=Pepper yellow leaf curl Indonesia virus TaxID=292477 RepID=Q0WX91_9GEMI|nr:nuclear shuttle protein [Pepper yellow leaf curl Indonesia virus]BAF02739.1 nuclear shuttle protein [Pepper yellow leaf curl Indonesia virus]
MRIPIRTPMGSNRDRRGGSGSIFRWNNPYSRYFGRRVGTRVYGMPFGGSSVPRRHVSNSVRRNLFSDHQDKGRKRRNSIEEVHDGTDYLLCNNTSKVSYISYPAMCRSDFSSRIDSFVRVLGFNVSGSVVARQQERVDGSKTSGIHGIFSTVVVRDKKPCEFSSVDPLIPFAEIFGHEKGACSTLRVRDAHRNRFVLVQQKKCVVNTALPVHVFRFVYSVRFNRYPLWVSFKDTTDVEPSGLYSNVSKNALLVYYVWLCDSNVTSDIHVKYDLDYIG